MSTEKIYQVTIKAIGKYYLNTEGLDYLDIGAGSGELIKKLKLENSSIKSTACDYTDRLMELPNQKVDIVNLNEAKLPYRDASFDVVTAIEVVEHLENQRGFLRDINRVLKPNGVCVISSPNILNLNSRLRYLWFGFAQLFGPLSFGGRKLEFSSGHISPISYFYLYHALKESGFCDISLDIDKMQRSGIVKLIPLFLPIKFIDILIKRKEIRKYKTLDSTNKEVVGQINSYKILVGRTIIVRARKQEG